MEWGDMNYINISEGLYAMIREYVKIHIGYKCCEQRRREPVSEKSDMIQVLYPIFIL